jgi:uncharacterized membrane protein
VLIAAYLATSYFGWRRTLIDDEVWTIFHAGQSLSEQIQSIRSDLVHPPLLYLLVRIWVGLFGQTDGAAKAFPLLMNLPTLVLFAWLASRVTLHWRLASALFAAKYLDPVNALNEVRMYGLGVLLAVAAMVLWEKWRENPTNAKLTGWALLMTLLVYTHLFGAVIVFAFVAANWLCGPRRSAFTLSSLVAGLAFLPWLLYALPVYLATPPRILHVAKIPFVAKLPYIFMGAIPDWYLTGVILTVAAILAHLVLLIFAWRGLRGIWPPHLQVQHAARWLWVAMLVVGIPVLYLSLYYVLVGPNFHPRFILAIMPAYWLSIILLAELEWRRGRILLYAVFVPWAVAILALNLVQARTTSPAYQAAVVMSGEHRPGDLILCKGMCDGLYWEWIHRLGRTRRIEALVGGGPMDVLQQVPVEKLDLGGTFRVWLAFGPDEKTATEIAFLKQHGFALQKESPHGRPYLLLLTRPGG